MEAASPPALQGSQPQLKSNAITFVSNLVIGVASTAPGFSLAATVGFIVGTAGIGLHAPAVILVSFIPMFFVAFGYRYMNKAETDAGTSFAWATSAFGPGLGWLTGWTMLSATLVVMATQSSIAGSYSLSLFDLEPSGSILGIDAKTFWITVIGVVWIVVMTLICYIGIEISARTQQGLLLAEIVTLAAFAVVALYMVYAGSAEGPGMQPIHPSIDWLNPFSMGFGPLLDGILLGVFLFWGWDSSVSVNEETEDGANAPGKAAVLSTVLLLLIYVVVTVAAQAFAGEGYLSNEKNAEDIFSGGLGLSVLGSPLDKLLIIAVLTSSAAATQTTILPAARAAYSMARKHALPGYFSEIHHRHQTPGHSTWVFGALSVAWFVGVNLTSDNVLADSLVACGFPVCFYYGITGFACAAYYRRQLLDSARNFFLVGLLPFLGGLALLGVFIKACIYYWDPANSSSEPVFGIGLPFVMGIGMILLGVVVREWVMVRHRRFFMENQPTVADPSVLDAASVS